ncbi:Rne/Rng family ribonuclease [Brachybacterium sp. J153]|uniref:Rne/Rng family ribonuclease n=1 Tax=Brachybacterium sp. J153 TaxID=3116488 RepID=UPI002E7A9387|nr:Rne/Rng family ribonuclease [Brachybacterium sp. J153]MEE1617182.1 Rne/Rng family ribonuclease [Brachybacterium sp. J153]
MADSTTTPDPEQTGQDPQAPAPARRRRRAAGAPAGAPAPVVVEEAAPSAPRTVVAAQSEEPAEPTIIAPKRTRRRAGAPAGAPEPVAAPEPSAASSRVAEEVDRADEINAADEVDESSDTSEAQETTETEPRPDSVVEDLRALASSRSEENADEDEDRARRREQVQLDFASLLFQAPTPRPAVERSAEDSRRGAEDEDDDVQERSDRADRASRRDRNDRDDRDESDSSDGEDRDGSTEDSSDEQQSSSGGSRRRRRRGGRGRRGRGRGEDGRGEDEDSTEGSEDSGSAADTERSAERGDSADATDTSETGDSEDESGEDGGSGSGSTSSRRRRRRRRSGSSSDDSTSPDDPPNTVVKVREARDEVKAVKGSTRLEAKRQRRREGRDAGRRRNVITEAEFLARRESVKRSMVVRERPGRTQIAVLEDDVLVEHYVAQKAQTSMVGNVYLGKVQNVLPSMEAAFVDIGKGRNAVLYAGEVNWDAVGLEGQPRRIELALKSGDSVLVQVTKDPIGHKGARLTSQISLPGRYVVFVPGGSMTGISRKLPDTERARLKKLMRQLIPEDAGVIVRTAAEGASEEELTHDVERLRAQWEKITKAQKSKSAPVALSQEPDIAIKVVRDVFNEDFTSLIVEGAQVHDDVHEYVSDVAPDLLERVTRHVGEKDVFAKHRIDEQLLKAMDRKVYLPSGGSLVIDRTEAMTVVDVNTGKFTGSGGSLEETVTKNNLEAAEEIVRQLRLRDIGGIIVIDFIDMVLESNRDLVLRRLVECLGRDRTKHQVAEVTSLGLVQMTRKRVGQGLVETFSTTCEHCHGRGLVVDLDGEHQHSGGGNGSGGSGGGSGEEGSSKSSKRRSRRSRGGAKEESTSHEELDGEVHRLAGDADSRALARATIASIAAASAGHAAPEVTVDGEVVAVAQDAAPASGDTPEAESDGESQTSPETGSAGE